MRQFPLLDGMTGSNGTGTPQSPYNCTLCPRLVQSRTQVVLPDIACIRDDGTADVVFVGEAPGEEEDRQGFPFVGPSGSLLRELIGRYIGAAYAYAILNLVWCRPVEDGRNGKPTSKEATTCRDTWVRPTLHRLKPSVVVTLGAYPFAYLTRRPLEDVRMEKVVGKVFRFQIDKQRGCLVPLYHPAYVLRNRDKMDDYELRFVWLRGVVDAVVRMRE